MKISSVREMHSLDARAMEAYGLPDYLLMENAGQAVYYAILRETGVAGRRFVVLCGPGNNGGDGLVVARKLASSGGEVRVLLPGEPDAYRGPALENLGIFRRSGGSIVAGVEPGEVAEAVGWCEVVVDGLLGTGVTRDVSGRLAEILEAVNRSKKRVFSIDIPSGVDGNTGQVRGVAIQADATVTFGLPKVGNLLPPGARFGGRLYVSHISFPPSLISEAPISVAVNEPAGLPEGSATPSGEEPHSLLILAGDSNRLGPASLAGEAFLRFGGQVALMTVPRSAELSLMNLPREIGIASQEETEAGTMALAALEDLLWLAEKACLVVVGHGFGEVEETRELARRFIEKVSRPLILDGETAKALGANIGLLRKRKEETVLVLDPREMSPIASWIDAEAGLDPVSAVKTLGGELGSTVVLLGGRTLMGFPDRTALVNLTGSLGGPSEGWGDVLAGMVGALCTSGMALDEAIRTSVFAHGLAEEEAEETEMEGHLSVETLVQCLAPAMESLRGETVEPWDRFQGKLEVI